MTPLFQNVQYMTTLNYLTYKQKQKQQNKKCTIRGSYCGDAEAVSTAKYLPTFQRINIPSPSGSISPRTVSLYLFNY